LSFSFPVLTNRSTGGSAKERPRYYSLFKDVDTILILTEGYSKSIAEEKGIVKAGCPSKAEKE